MSVTRRQFFIGSLAGLSSARVLFARSLASDYDIRSFGAVGNGSSLDTHAIQAAIDHASANGGGRVLIPGGRRFLTGALVLRDAVDLHLADDAMLLASPNPIDYGEHLGIINAKKAEGVRISGTGMIDGQAMQFVSDFSQKDERWEPRAFRPRMFHLERCTNLEITNITFGHAPQWGMHLLACEHVLVDGVRIRNFIEVPNCDGIDPDHYSHVEIKNCDIVCADDGIVIKTSQATGDFGPSHDIVVRDCIVTTRDSGIKIGTETFGDISKVLFERCNIVSGGRGPTITHRQKGNIEDIEFRDIQVTAEHHASRWWGWGEAISITAWPRSAEGQVGSLRNIRLRNIRATAENSVRIDGQEHQPIKDVLLDNVDITIDKWTNYEGEHFDNRPTKPATAGLEPHNTPAFCIRNAENVLLKNCKASWGTNRQKHFSNALQARSVANLKTEGFIGKASDPDKMPAFDIR
jgi:hypothetical protein